MRLRTLPVSIAGVITAVGFALHDRVFQWLPALLCLLFAVLAQIASNFANEYYDYRDGLDRAGREGPRRGVTEGDITPGAMKRATYAVLALACVIGLSLIYWGGWWLLPAGIVIALGAIAYSAGPYPLSRHGLGEVAVMFFFGIIPVNLTYYIQADAFTMPVLLGSVAIGLMGANVLVVAAGMEGALASAVGGLVDRPIIAVPTSVGYGANFGGMAALLAMLNSCASGVSVVNIDNGFGAGYLAAMINRPGHQPQR